jgi:hypothetical protein
MKIKHDTENYTVKAYGTEPIYTVLCKTTHEFIVAEGKSAALLREVLESAVYDGLKDIAIAGMFDMARKFGEVDHEYSEVSAHH